MQEFVNWCNKMKISGVEIVYTMINEELTIVKVKSDNRIRKLRIPNGVVEVNCDFQCDTLILPESCKRLYGDGHGRCKIENIVCNSDDISVEDGCFESSSTIKSFKCNEVSLGRRAFSGCKSLKTFDCMKVTALNQRCFYNCESLENFNFSKVDCWYIEERAFCCCSSLKVLNLHHLDNIVLKDSCFSLCGFEDIILPKHTYFEKQVFSDCDKLKSIHFGNVAPSCEESDILRGCVNPELMLIFGRENLKYLLDALKIYYNYDISQYNMLNNYFGAHRHNGNLITFADKVVLRD